ncbi:hypothetical protein EVAR_31112_1 [Eumeta japonica]|uniref:Uncharacterized protein n=1 Tax=Eumeta variegata TaxID=151549 RepID=A0A4C1VE87_EUMVA|nr:hypothetical protein EVAR_31112_1 [Eumeta japonica]
MSKIIRVSPHKPSPNVSILMVRRHKSRRYNVAACFTRAVRDFIAPPRRVSGTSRAAPQTRPTIKNGRITFTAFRRATGINNTIERFDLWIFDSEHNFRVSRRRGRCLSSNFSRNRR